MRSNQKKVLNFVRGVIVSNGTAPTIHEICQQVGLSSTESVHRILCALQEQGLITRVPNVARGIRLT